MTGKFLVGFIVVCGLVGGVTMYYLQVYAYYEEVAANGTSDVVLVEKSTKQSAPIVYSNFKGIDAQSSPIRYRACFTTQVALDELKKAFTTFLKGSPGRGPL